MVDCCNQRCAFTQFTQIEKNQLIELHEELEGYCKVLRKLGFTSSKFVINLFKAYFLPNFVNERDIEHAVIKEAKQFILFKFSGIQLMNITDFNGGAIIRC